MKEGASVFVKIEDYKEVLEVINAIKKNLAEARKTLDELTALKEQENSELQAWTSNLEEIEAKIEDIDKMMYEPSQEW